MCVIFTSLLAGVLRVKGAKCWPWCPLVYLFAFVIQPYAGCVTGQSSLCIHSQSVTLRVCLRKPSCTVGVCVCVWMGGWTLHVHAKIRMYTTYLSVFVPVYSPCVDMFGSCRLELADRCTYNRQLIYISQCMHPYIDMICVCTCTHIVPHIVPHIHTHTQTYTHRYRIINCMSSCDVTLAYHVSWF